jgi:hypothetical protein
MIITLYNISGGIKMIKKYELRADPKECKDDKTLYKMRLNINDKIKKVLRGTKELLKEHDKFEIWKVKLPYEIKLVLILKNSEEDFLIIEAIAINPSKQELKKMQVEFNSCLKKQCINTVIKDTNNY